MQNELAFGDGGKGRVEETGEKDVVRFSLLESNLLSISFSYFGDEFVKLYAGTCVSLSSQRLSAV